MGMTFRAWVAISLALVTVSARAKDSAPRARADLTIREMTSVQVGNSVYRALLGLAEIYPFLIIERVQLGDSEGDEPALVATWRLPDIEGGSGFHATFEGDQISSLRWKGDRLEFMFHASRAGDSARDRIRGNLACVVSGILESKPSVVCRPARL
jgi:hypothetical protein